MIRAFLAVELSEDLRAHIAQVQRDLKQRLSREISKGVRISWVQPNSIHLTVKFLGDIDEQHVDPLREALSTLIKSHPIIQIPMQRLGAFPHPQQPRVLWVGPSELWEKGEDAKRLAELHQAVEGCCQSFGFAPEGRPLSPHLTVARIKEGGPSVGQALAKNGVMDRPLSPLLLGLMVVGSVVLMKSELRPTGAVYTKLWEIVISNQ
ncbi:MAG: RNA 2',3'-cyclic phosphodiesterase [Nitrospirae bacterium]|nr:RNA 2',3'-cyclic phosphodiesterase [Nitrospirota bacterium]